MEEKKRGVFYIGVRNGKFGYYTEKWEGLETEDNMDYVKYEGEIKNGDPNGQGTFTLSNGDKYEGEVKKGLQNGQGTKTWSNGDKYVGVWKNGKRNGQGTYTYSDGRKYEGEWKDGGVWNGTLYDKYGNITYKYDDGEIE